MAIVQVPSSEWVDPVAKALNVCLVAERRHRDRADAYRPASIDPPPARPVVVAAVNRKTALQLEEKVEQAFQEYRTLIGVAVTPERELPRDLVDSCERRLHLGRFDPKSIEFVFEHVAGHASDRSVPPELATAVRPSDLRIALHPARGANESFNRLAAIVTGRSKASRATARPKLDELEGYGRALDWGLAAADDLAAYGRGELSWSDCEPGVLLAGPPGTGKTMFAGALARQAGVPIVTGSLARWQAVGEAHLGTTIKAMRAFFDEAWAASPCVALVDELDSFGDRARFDGQNANYSLQVVNAFLECLDGHEGRSGVLLVGTTNIPDRIDPAILRAGRFDRCITIPLPSTDDLARILRFHLGGDLAEHALVDVARRASGGSGADCAAWIRRARGRARRARREVTMEDLVREIASTGELRSAEADARIAVHECGHAVVAHLLNFEIGDVVLDCVPSGGASAGFRLRWEVATAERLRDLLAAFLGGRAAESLVYGTATSGSATDLADATDLCRNMHCRWGLGRTLSVSDPAFTSDDLKYAVELDLARAFERAISLIRPRLSDLDRLSSALLQRRVLAGREVEEMLGSSKPRKPATPEPMRDVNRSPVEAGLDPGVSP